MAPPEMTARIESKLARKRELFSLGGAGQVREAISSKAAGYLAFYKELSKSFHQIGSVFPSSKSLASVMIRPLEIIQGPRRILEVGPGTGPFTVEILRSMRSEDQLTICEINSALLKQLRSSLESNQDFLEHRSRVTFIEGPVQQLRAGAAETQFDIIVCGLPFSIFKPEVAEEIMKLFHDLLAPSGHLTFFEYWGFRDIFTFINTPANRRRMRAVDRVIQKWQGVAASEGAVSSKVCLTNFPPAKSLDFCFRP